MCEQCKSKEKLILELKKQKAVLLAEFLSQASREVLDILRRDNPGLVMHLVDHFKRNGN